MKGKATDILGNNRLMRIAAASRRMGADDHGQLR